MKTPACAVLLAFTPALAGAQVFAGPEFRVNGYTTGAQSYPSVAMGASGDFRVVWIGETAAGDAGGVGARRFDARGTAAGADFQVNTYTTGGQGHRSPDVALDRAGNFVAVWPSEGQDGSYMGVFGQRFDAAGGALGAEFQVNTYTTGLQGDQNVASVAVARAPDGRFVVAWQGTTGPGTSDDVFAQRYDAAGVRAGGEFRVNTYTTNSQGRPDVAMDASGSFVVVWSSLGQDGSNWGVFGRRFAATGAPLGVEFQVNTYTTLNQGGGQYWGPSIATAPGGEFVVVWDDVDQADVFGQRYDRFGNRAGAEFRANLFTPTIQTHSAVAMDELGNFVVAWGQGNSFYFTQAMGRRFAADGTPRSGEFQMDVATSAPPHRFPAVASDAVGNFLFTWGTQTNDPGDPFYSVRAQRFGGLFPASLAVDTFAGSSNGNGILEPDEGIDIVPTWRNQSTATQNFGGVLSDFTGPGDPFGYGIADNSGDYGTVADGAAAQCGSLCYTIALSQQTPRPALHWDATAIESITPDAQGQQKKWTLHVGESFADMPPSNGFYRFVETLLHRGITGGCGGTQYCPGTPTTREQMAVFVLLAKEPAGYVPPACAPPNLFADVPETSGFCRWIEELSRRGVVSGCGGGNYCPSQSVTREQMAVFVLRTLDPTLVPPPCAPPNLFGDVPETSGFCRWIEELANRAIVSGCGGGNYCPASPVSREQMGVFLGVTFALALYGT